MSTPIDIVNIVVYAGDPELDDKRIFFPRMTSEKTELSVSTTLHAHTVI